MNYIVIEVCCFSCLKFFKVSYFNFDNLLELKQYLKELSIESDHCFIVYDETASHEIIRYDFCH